MTTNKKILIGVGISLGIYAIFIRKSGWDGETVWTRHFGRSTQPKEPKQPIKSNADGGSCSCKGSGASG